MGDKFGLKTDDPRTKGGGGGFIKGFKDGVVLLRFVQRMGPDEDKYGGWTVFWEHFDPAITKSFPCIHWDRAHCPGCVSDVERVARRSKKYLVNAVNVNTGYIDLYKIPVSCIDDLMRYADGDGGDITKRDYGIVRFERDGMTKYSVDKEDKYKFDFKDDFEELMKDHQEALKNAYLEAFEDLPASWYEDDDENTGNQERPVKAVANPSRLTVVKPKEQEEPPPSDDPPSEPAAAEAESAQEEPAEVRLSVDDLHEMGSDDIRGLFKQCGLENKIPDTDDAKELADALIALIGVEEA